MRTVAGVILIAVVSALNGTEPGKITGLVHCDGTGANVAVWAITIDCRVSYQSTDFDHNRFVFDSIPPGAYTLAGSCDGAYAIPSPEFLVHSGATVNVDVNMAARADEVGNMAPGISPLNGRVVDDKGHALP